MYRIQGIKDIFKSIIVTILLNGATQRIPRQKARALYNFANASDFTPGTCQNLHFKLCNTHIERCIFLDFLFCLRVGKLPNKLLKGNDPQPLRKNEIVIVKVDEQRQVTLTIWQSKTDQLGQSTDLFFVGNREYGLSLRFSNKYPGVQIRLNFWFILKVYPLMRYQFSFLLA